MSSYVLHKLLLSDYQYKLLIKHVNNEVPITLKITHKGNNEVNLYLPNKLIGKIQKKANNNKGSLLDLSTACLHYNRMNNSDLDLLFGNGFYTSKKTHNQYGLTNSDQLDKFMSFCPFYEGIKSNGKDEFKGHVKEPSCGILNIDKPSGEGTHWVCWLVNKEGRAFYFDSFGATIPEVLYEYLKRDLDRKIYSSSLQLQDEDSDLCGYFCVSFLRYLYDHDMNKQAFVDFITKFDVMDTKANDDILIRYFEDTFK